MSPLFKTEVVIGENTKQLLLERNVILTLPALKIRNIHAEVRQMTTDVIADKVVIQGVLHKQIFFVGEDNIVHHQAEDFDFSTFVDIPGADPGMNVQLSPTIETVIFNLMSPVLLHHKAVIEFFVKITETRQLNLQLGNGPLVRLDQVVGENTRQELFENFITLTQPALKIDDITVQIRDITTHMITDKVIIQGVIHKQIYYIGTNNVEFHQAEDLEFSTFVDIPGAVTGMDVEVVTTVEFVHYDLRDETTLLQKVVAEFYAKVTESVQMNVQLGSGALVKLENMVGENTKQILAESVCQLPISTLKIREIIAKIIDLTTEVIDDKVIIQGILHKQIFYIGEDNLEHHQVEEIPLSTFVDIFGATRGMNVRTDTRIETILFELEDVTTLRQKVVIEFFANVTQTQQLLVQLVSPYYL